MPQREAHRIDRNPDWKVFLNMATAAGALVHVRSASGPAARGVKGVSSERSSGAAVHSHLPTSFATKVVTLFLVEGG